MRIISGQFRRRQIKSPGGHMTRPTTDRTRESIFNLVATRVRLDGAHIIDLYAGSGALGLEALSRGAANVTFVESNSRVFAVARENAIDLGVEMQCDFIRMDALVFLKKYDAAPYELALADPPYNLPSLALLPDLVLPRLTDDGVFMLEHDARVSLDHHPHLETSRAYGKSVVSVFHKQRPAEESHEDELKPERS